MNAIESPKPEQTVAPSRRSAEPIHYVNDARYDRLVDFWTTIRAPSDSVIPPTEEVRDILLREARNLDDRYYDAWLALFSDECLYWIPNRFEPEDPRLESAIYLDDRRRMADRVALIRTGHLHAQTPPSRTRRMISNIEQRLGAADRTLVRANIVIWEYRRDRMRPYVGWQAYEVVRDPSTGQPRIDTKIVCLLDCDAPQGNYSFIL